MYRVHLRVWSKVGVTRRRTRYMRSLRLGREQSLRYEELFGYGVSRLVLHIDLVIQLLHGLVSKFACQLVQDSGNLWMRLEYVLAHNGCCIIRWEEMLVVLEHSHVVLNKV